MSGVTGKKKCGAKGGVRVKRLYMLERGFVVCVTFSHESISHVFGLVSWNLFGQKLNSDFR